jgi:rRNA maturation endonuclease Nob1
MGREQVSEAAFNIRGGDVGSLFRRTLGALTWNGLSPFAERLAEYHGGGDGSAETGPLVPGLTPQIAAVLARPDVRISHRYAGGAASTGAFAAFCSRADGEDIVVVFPQADRGYLVRLFSSSTEYFSWWLNLLSSNADEPAGNAASTLSLEALLYWLHAVDMYRRAKYQSMLSYGPPKALSIPVTEFIESVAKSAASRDLQWLLPSFLALAPGLSARKLEPRSLYLQTLADGGFLIPGENSQSREKIFYFGDAAEKLGSEFIGGVDLTVGLEIAVWTERGALPVFEGFLAPTRAANHLIEIEPGANGAGLAKHQAMTQRQLYARLVGLLSAALHPGAPKVALRRALLSLRAAPAPTKQKAAEPAQIVCANCGQANPAKMKFCGECGSRLSRETAQVAGTKAASPRSGSENRPAPLNTPTSSKARQTMDRGPTVRQWFRMTPCRWFREPVLVETGQIEDLARLLRLVRDRKLVPESEFKRLHAALRLKGPGAAPWLPSLWTVSLGSLRWSRWDQGNWTPADRPKFVYLDAPSLKIIGHWMPAASGDRVLYVPASPQSLCPSCRKPLRQGTKFCSSCGKQVSPASRQSLAPASGKAAPPKSRGTDKQTASAKAARSAPAMQRCPNPRCGRTVPAGKKFCTACGTRAG